MSYECFNRLQTASKEDFDGFVGWLFSQTLTELRKSRDDMAATRTAWIHYFRRGLKADLLPDELMTHLPELFRRVQYPEDEARGVLAMIKELNLSDMGVEPIETGVSFNEQVGQQAGCGEPGDDTSVANAGSAAPGRRSD